MRCCGCLTCSLFSGLGTFFLILMLIFGVVLSVG